MRSSSLAYYAITMFDCFIPQHIIRRVKDTINRCKSTYFAPDQAIGRSGFSPETREGISPLLAQYSVLAKRAVRERQSRCPTGAGVMRRRSNQSQSAPGIPCLLLADVSQQGALGNHFLRERNAVTSERAAVTAVETHEHVPFTRL